MDEDEDKKVATSTLQVPIVKLNPYRKQTVALADSLLLVLKRDEVRSKATCSGRKHHRWIYSRNIDSRNLSDKQIFSPILPR